MNVTEGFQVPRQIPQDPTRIKMMAGIMQHLNLSNRAFSSTWKIQRYPFSRAITMGAATVLGRLGWKWWEAAPAADDDAQRRSLLHIFEFAVSWALRQDVGAEQLLAEFERGFSEIPTPQGPSWGDSICYAVERIAVAALNEGVLPTMYCIGRVCAFYDLPLEQIERAYVPVVEVSRPSLDVLRTKGYAETA